MLAEPKVNPPRPHLVAHPSHLFAPPCDMWCWWFGGCPAIWCRPRELFSARRQEQAAPELGLAPAARALPREDPPPGPVTGDRAGNCWLTQGLLGSFVQVGTSEPEVFNGTWQNWPTHTKLVPNFTDLEQGNGCPTNQRRLEPLFCFRKCPLILFGQEKSRAATGMARNLQSSVNFSHLLP